MLRDVSKYLIELHLFIKLFLDYFISKTDLKKKTYEQVPLEQVRPLPESHSILVEQPAPFDFLFTHVLELEKY